MESVVGIARYSTEEQRDGHSIATQRDAIERYCAEHGLTLLGVFVDEAVSGTVEPSARPGFSAAMKAAKRGVGVVCYRVDRISRDVAHVSNFVRWCQRGQHALHSATEGGLVDTRDPSQVTMLLMRGVLAQHERATVARRVSDALQKLKRDGLVYTTPAFGTRAVDGRIVVDEAEATIRREVAGLRAAGLSLRGVVATLAERGIVGRTGRPLQLTQVARMLAC